MLNHESIKEFKEIYKQEFGGELSDQSALELANDTLNIFRIISRKQDISKTDD